MARLSAAGQRRRQRRTLKNAELKERDEMTLELQPLTNLKKQLQQPKNMTKPSPFFARLPPELRNKIYHFVFVWDTVGNENCAGPWDNTLLAPLLACKQFHAEAHELAYCHLWHRIENVLSEKERSLACRYGTLSISKRKSVNKLWLEMDQACYGEDYKLKIWKLATYALSMPRLAVTQLYLGIRSCYCYMPNWDMKMGFPGESAIALQLLGLLRIWPTLKEIRLGLNVDFLELWNYVRPDLLMHAIMREICAHSRGYERASKPAIVFDKGWEKWVHGWMVVGGGLEHNRNHEPVKGLLLAGRDGSAVEGRVVSVCCVECADCVAERESGRDLGHGLDPH